MKVPRTGRVGDRAAARSARGAKARREGRGAEALAALWLMAKGWRVVGFAIPAAHGEVDRSARRGQVLAVVEVKRQRTLDEAPGAVTERQRARLRAPAEALAARRPALAGFAIRLDLIAVGPRGLPRRLADAWPQHGGGR